MNSINEIDEFEIDKEDYLQKNTFNRDEYLPFLSQTDTLLSLTQDFDQELDESELINE